ncbi:MAG: NAD(P)-dependent oxidoreductase [Porticoccaceae bacterium]|nr:NAD(P)-dependent oxidoreductase [Porticoccaceae bacterium]
MSICIIGGAGFVGTRLSKRMSRAGKDFGIFDAQLSKAFGSKTIIGDVCKSVDYEALPKSDVLINLAAVHRDDVRPLSRYDEVNVGGAEASCNFARQAGINKIVFTSSVAIYGFAPPETGEEGEPNYFNDYGRTKYLAEQVYKKWQAEDPDNRSLVIIRPTVIFGEGNRGNVCNLFTQIARKRFVMFGDGKNRKSMAYVENVVAFLEYSLDFPPGLHIYNYVDKPDLDMNTLVKTARKALFGENNVGIRLPRFIGVGAGYLADGIAKITGKSLPVSSIRVKKFLGTTQFGSAVSKTGFVAPVKLEDAIERTLRYEFIEDNSDQPEFLTE